MIHFVTPTALAIEAATTMGVSVKEDGAIGKFGTGLKYAIAGILRLGGSVRIKIDGDKFAFTARESDIRGKTFRIVHCNGQPCGFTTDLGKHWEPWQLFRELASNALDEGGCWTRNPLTGRTIITVECREVEAAEHSEAVFLANKEPLVESSFGATIYEGPSPHYYYKGIRAGSFGCVAPVTVDVAHGDLSEDRLLDLAVVRRELGWAFRTATRWNSDLLLSVVAQQEPGSFWIEHVSGIAFNSGELPARMLDFLADRKKFIKHPSFRAALDSHLRKSGGGRWTEVPMTDRHKALIALGEALAGRVGVDPIPRDRIHFTTDLADAELAVTRMDTREVWFSTKLAMLGRDEFLAGYLEEAIHAMTGLRDCTRELQNALLAIIVSNAQAAKEQA